MKRLALLDNHASPKEDFCQTSGAYKVGYTEFTSKLHKNDCSVFYPSLGDGHLGVPFLTYGADHIKGFENFAEMFTGVKPGPHIARSMQPLLNLQVPVFQGATPALASMQPLFFSHGLQANRMWYSSLFRELASCGFCVIALTHNDASADYSPVAGHFSKDLPFYDFEGRNKGVKQRQQELLALVEEVTAQEQQIVAARLTDQVVLMGHSFGGITVLGASARCSKAVAVIAMDPWFFPLNKDFVKTAQHQKCLVMQTEHWAGECANHPMAGDFDQDQELQEFISRSKAELRILSDCMHFNQSDAVLVAPVQQYKLFRGSKPQKDYVERYLANAWLAMQFLSLQKLCDEPGMCDHVAKLLERVKI